MEFSSIRECAALYGYDKEAVEIFEEMKGIGAKPDETTYLSVLSACSHVGLVKKGLEIFHLWQRGMKEELERLQKNHPKIQAVVRFASSQDRQQIRDQNPALNGWLWQLRDVIDEADDVLDDLEYMNLENQLTKNKMKRKERQEQQLELYRARETGSNPTYDFIGRGKEKEFVMKWLRKTSNEYQNTLYNNISLLTIVGQGGMGKTTLLQQVYKDEMTKVEFDLKMWICVSNDSDANSVVAHMLESLKKERPCLETLDVLQESLESMVKSKKFLLVLDDIWEKDEQNDEDKWRKVLVALNSGKLGSKIVVTTRMESVALMISKFIRNNEMLKLEGLKYDECLLLFNRHAFESEEIRNAHHNLTCFAKKIVRKISGSPLAARVIGGSLRSYLDESHWERVSKYDMGSQNGILDVLKLTYTSLPEVLQNCLSFCCTFPQDYEFDKDDLVRMWTVLGFIQLKNIREPENIPENAMKYEGERYFDILVKKSLFDEFHDKYKTYYKLHDLLHEMIRSISIQECFSIVGDEELFLRKPETIRYLFVETRNLVVLKEIEKCKKLHSLIMCNFMSNEEFVVVLAKICTTLTSIRLMCINAPFLCKIPEEIMYLRHLRYLKINEASITRLPTSLSKLYHLQFMIYDEAFKSQQVHDILPREMNNLPNLHYLKLPFSWMHEIGKLNSLKGLDGFYIKNESGYRIEELEHMNELNLLAINLLENVRDARDARCAKLCNKKNLKDLSLAWCDNRCISTDNGQNHLVSNAVVSLHENVLDNLKPPSSLEKLKINSYLGARSTIWMNQVDFLFNLEHIIFENCLEWETLPPFGQLPLLKSLHLRNMRKVKGLAIQFHGNYKVRIFPSLQVLYIEQLNALKDWFAGGAEEYECFFPCLTKMYLKDCPKLQELPVLPSKLEKLEIDNIGWKGCYWLQGMRNYCNISIQNCPNLLSLKGYQEVETTEKWQLILSELEINDPSLLTKEPLRSVTSIQKLKISINDAVISFLPEAEQWLLQVSPSLCVLEFEYLESLQSLPSSLENLSSLEILRVKNVPQLKQLPKVPASLESLVLEELKSLEHLSDSLSSSLKYLDIKSIPLKELPDLPPSLCELSLSHLSNLDCLPSCLHNRFYLKKLVINSVPKLQVLPDHLPLSLCELFISNLPNLQSLPLWLSMLSSLNKLVINELYQLQDLPRLPRSLESLTIHLCNSQLKERYQRNTGSDWDKIARIPHLNIKVDA
ncbi:hypothetical protein M5K25_009726 [Dendrobium thyrsiflorum]|uniref:Uncharacterized protein n=1 Tax=Dendrobium thyrsiflorum TaxID=117978 RepID=A0ABD0V767_DENTH